MPTTMDRPATDVAVRPNTYKTILVHAEAGVVASHRVEVAASLARVFDARLIGVGAQCLDPTLFNGPFTGPAAGEWINFVQDQITKSLAAAQTAFRRDAAEADIEWREFQEYPSRALVNVAHAADLIVVSPHGGRSALEAADPADVMMAAGRPILVVPEGRSHLVGMSIVVAWKNTREARRAVHDARPFLAGAERIAIVAVGPDAHHGGAEATARYLAGHGVAATTHLLPGSGLNAAEELLRFAEREGADLLVMGAYGHSRLREWVFGGVTRDILRTTPLCCLMSH